MRTLLIIGGTGELGRKVVAAAAASDGTGWSGEIIATYFSNFPAEVHAPRVTWRKLDCRSHKDVRQLVVELHSLGAVLYCAVPKHTGAAGKQNPQLRAGIVDDVVNAAEAAVMVAAKFVVVSTDLVFDGKNAVGNRYNEKSPTSPLSPYAEYKSIMEEQLMGLSSKVIIARTSLILTLEEGYVGKGVQFVLDCINGKRGEIELFTDEWRNMSFADDLGKAMIELSKPECKHTGLLHMVSDEVTSRWEIAQLLAKELGLEHLLGKHAKSGLSSKSGLNRPENCALSTDLRKSVLKTHIRGVSERFGKTAR